MATKTKSGNEPKLSAADLAASIVATKAADDAQRAENRRRDLTTYRELIGELAGTPSAARGSDSWQNLRLASRIIAERLGHDADSDLKNLDAISHHERLTKELGDLRVVLDAINDEQRGAEARHMELAERHRHERSELTQHFQQVLAKQNQISVAIEAADAAQQALSHIQGIEG